MSLSNSPYLAAPTSLPLSYQQVEHSYNYGPDFAFNLPFHRLLLDVVTSRPDQPTVLDIGCGAGIGQDHQMQREIGKLAGRFWGVEPDANTPIEPGLFERVERCFMEQADLPESSVDVAYAFMVMEHVADPQAFLRSVAYVLKPGGVFLFASPNAHHFFGFASKWSHRLGIDELLLRLIKGREELDYHYPLEYRCNTRREVMHHALAAGLNARIAFYESPTGLASYFPGPFRVVRQLLIAKRRVWKQPSALCTILALLEKPAES